VQILSGRNSIGSSGDVTDAGRVNEDDPQVD
jgi:hypothetical protein